MRRIIQMQVHGKKLVVLCDDGTLWARPQDAQGADWIALVPPSEEETDPESLDRITKLKAHSIAAENHFHITGYVLSHESGRKCVVDLGAVRWLEQSEFWELMHPIHTAITKHRNQD